MPFPPINLHSRISSPGKDLFRKKKANNVPPPSMFVNKTKEETETDDDTLSTSVPSLNLGHLGQKQVRRKNQLPYRNLETDGEHSWLTLPKPLNNSCESVPRSSSGESAAHRSIKHPSRRTLGMEEVEEEIQFSLSLTPEAIIVIQKRNLEKQMMAKQQKCCASADFRHRRVFPSKRAPGGPKSSVPVAKLDGLDDITTIVKISLLNDQYKYDDVEYEEEDADVDETVVRKCKEWLKGVESAAAFGKVDKLASLPHLKT